VTEEFCYFYALKRSWLSNFPSDNIFPSLQSYRHSGRLDLSLQNLPPEHVPHFRHNFLIMDEKDLFCFIVICSILWFASIHIRRQFGNPVCYSFFSVSSSHTSMNTIYSSYSDLGGSI
jgi:hypothetical protein